MIFFVYVHIFQNPFKSYIDYRKSDLEYTDRSPTAFMQKNASQFVMNLILQNPHLLPGRHF